MVNNAIFVTGSGLHLIAKQKTCGNQIKEYLDGTNELKFQLAFKYLIVKISEMSLVTIPNRDFIKHIVSVG